MEEKWWSKFQTKSSDGETDKDRDVLSMKDIKEVVEQELQGKFDESLSKGREITKEALQYADETLKNQPPISDVYRNLKDKAAQMRDWADDTMNSPQVQDALNKAGQTIHEVYETGEDVLEDIKDWANSNFQKNDLDGSEDVNDIWMQGNLDQPIVDESFSAVKEFATDALDVGKQLVNNTVDWANEIRNRKEVQETISNVKNRSKEVVQDAKDGLDRLIHDPHVVKNVENVKIQVENASKSFQKNYEEIKNNRDLQREFDVFKRSAAAFGKSSARLAVAAFEEVRTNEKVVSAVEKGKDISLDLMNKGAKKLQEILKTTKNTQSADWSKMKESECRSEEDTSFDDTQEGK